MKYQNTRGFSLVELSVVIIIIGLLVGGISGGSMLVKQAEIRSVVADLKNMQTYYATFKTTYDAVPGDFKNADTYWTGTSCHATVSTACNGDGDGVIRWRDVTTTAAGVGDEAGRALKHLSLSGIMPISVGQLTITYAGGLNLLSTATQLVPPLAKSDSTNCLFYAYNTVSVATTTDAIGENAAGTTFLASPWAGASTNAIFLGGIISTANKSCAKGALSPTAAFSVDQKIDDGVYSSTSALGAGTGAFRAMEGMDPPTSTCLSGGNYNVTGGIAKSCFVGFIAQ